MGRPKEMAARRHIADGVEAQLVGIPLQGPQEFHHVLQDFHVEDQLFIAGGQPTLQPARCVVDQVRATITAPQVAIEVS